MIDEDKLLNFINKMIQDIEKDDFNKDDSFGRGLNSGQIIAYNCIKERIKGYKQEQELFGE